MSISRPLVIAREDVVRVLRAVELDGALLEEPDFRVTAHGPQGFLVIALPDGSSRNEFFRQAFLLLGEDLATKLVCKHRLVGEVAKGQILHFPGVTVATAA